MGSLFLYRNIYKLSYTLSRNCGILTIRNSRCNSSVCNNTMISTVFLRLKWDNPSLLLCRYMAKVKTKKGQNVVKIDEAELSKYFNLERLKSDFTGILENYKKCLVEQATLRSLSAVEQITVKYDGETYMIQDLAEIGKKGGKEIILDLSAFSGAVPCVLEAIRKSPLGLNPNQQGASIIVPIPKVTRERRESMYKAAKSMFNKTKEKIRNIQNKYIAQTSDFERISKDDVFRLKTQLTELGNKYTEEAEELLKIKEKELLQSS